MIYNSLILATIKIILCNLFLEEKISQGDEKLHKVKNDEKLHIFLTFSQGQKKELFEVEKGWV